MCQPIMCIPSDDRVTAAWNSGCSFLRLPNIDYGALCKIWSIMQNCASDASSRSGWRWPEAAVHWYLMQRAIDTWHETSHLCESKREPFWIPAVTGYLGFNADWLCGLSDMFSLCNGNVYRNFGLLQLIHIIHDPSHRVCTLPGTSSAVAERLRNASCHWIFW